MVILSEGGTQPVTGQSQRILGFVWEQWRKKEPSPNLDPGAAGSPPPCRENVFEISQQGGEQRAKGGRRPGPKDIAQTPGYSLT